MKFAEYVSGHIEVMQLNKSALEFKIQESIDLIFRSFHNSNKLLICGNGGSAADSQHFAAEFISAIDHSIKRKGLPAIALTTDSSVITARANDYGYEEIFARQVEALGNENDVLIGLTTSGKSKNVIRALEKAKDLNMKTIVFTGIEGIHGIDVDIDLAVKSNNTQYIQESHILIYHYICMSVEKLIEFKN